MRSTPSSKVNSVKLHLVNGLPYREIARKVKLSLGTIHNIARKHKVERFSKKGGRPTKLSDTIKRNVVRNITTGKCDTAVQAAKILQTTHNNFVSPQTVRNVLKNVGLKARRKLKKPAISAVNRRKRLKFGKRHEHWTTADWSRVIWSDETKINRFSSDGRLWYWTSPGEALSQRTIQPTVKYGGGSIMVWGCITYQGTGDITWIEGTMNADVYCAILNQNLLGSHGQIVD